VRRVAAVFVLALAAAQPAAASDTGLVVSSSIAPRPAFFGEQVTARVEVVVRSPADPDSVELAASFTPYSAVGHAHSSRSSANGVTTLGYVYRLACLNDGCLPRDTLRAVTLPVAHVRARTAGGGRVQAEVRWPSVLVAPRVTPAEARAARPHWRVQLGLPPVTYRTEPGTATPLAAVAVLLALLGAGLIAYEALRRRRLLRERAERRSAIVRALDLVRESEGRGVEDRRKALSLLSRLLAAEDGGLLARDAERLAWERSEPSPERIDALVREVERQVVRT
jgi:hypothetical protein